MNDLANHIDEIVAASATIPGWTVGEDARELVIASYELPAEAVIVEIGVFMGRCTVLLATPRRLRGSGKVHSVDPFDCSGDSFSVPFYLQELAATGESSLSQVFWHNMTKHKVTDLVELHKGTARDIAAGWAKPIDLLLLDGDQSLAGARAAYESWISFLKRDGVLVLRNTRDRPYSRGHDGHRRLAVEEVLPPRYSGIRQVGATTFATKQF